MVLFAVNKYFSGWPLKSRGENHWLESFSNIRTCQGVRSSRRSIALFIRLLNLIRVRNRHPVETILSSISYEDAGRICHLETTLLPSSLCSHSIYFCKVNAEFALHVESNMKSKVERSIFWVACHISQVGILSSSHFRWVYFLFFSFLF